MEGIFSSRSIKGLKKKTVPNALRYLDVLAETGIHSAAAQYIDVVPGTASAWRQDPDFVITIDDEVYTFDELCNQAMEINADAIEAEVYRRGVTGIEEPIVYKGMIMSEIDEETGLQRAVTITKHSDRLLEVLLKGKRPQYAGKSDVEIHMGEAGGVLVVPSQVDNKSWSEQIKLQQSNARKGLPPVDDEEDVIEHALIDEIDDLEIDPTE